MRASLSVGVAMMGAMESSALRFATAAKAIGPVVAARRLSMPLFRSPPRLDGAPRTIKRRASGVSTVAVRLRGRPFTAVLADMIEGVVVVNRLAGAEAEAVRDALWVAVAPLCAPAGAAPTVAA